MSAFQILEAETKTVTAEEINYEHQMFVDSLRSAFQHAIRCGELLTEKKRRLDHGEWMPWVMENCRFSYRTAALYMQLYEKYKRNVQRVASFNATSLLAALGMLREPDEKPDEKPEKEAMFQWVKEPSVATMLVGWDATDKAIQLLKHADRDPETATYYLNMLTEKVRRWAVELGLL